jgi:hypothetical protein
MLTASTENRQIRYEKMPEIVKAEACRSDRYKKRAEKTETEKTEAGKTEAEKTDAET